MASRIRAGGLFESAPIKPETMTLVSTIQAFGVIGSLPRLRKLAAGADQHYYPPRKRLVSLTARTIASSAFKPDFARALATTSLAVSQGRIPLSSRLSSIIEPMERFCRAAASFRARCVRSAKLIVRRDMIYTQIRKCRFTDFCIITPTYHTDKTLSFSVRAPFVIAPPLMVKRGHYNIALTPSGSEPHSR